MDTGKNDEAIWGAIRSGADGIASIAAWPINFIFGVLK